MQNTKFHSSRRIAFSAEKSITLICAMQKIYLHIYIYNYSGTCVNGHLRRAVTLHKAVSTESPNGIFHALHTH